MMSDAWGWTARDHILSVLPLHHIHGLVNVVTTALWCGATCEFVPRFDPDTTWARLGSGGITMFMAVPTIYVHLIKAWEAKSRNERLRLSAACRSVRLMVSGSSALPTQVLQKWQSITGHTLLERYGMTEVGMAIANPLDGERVPGSVGMPLPGVRVRLVDDSGRTVAGDASGQIEIRGPGSFLEYWRDSRATDAAFRDGWFQTGDVAARHGDYYRILGRANVDIIKTGGYKVSAVEIEQAFAAHPDVEECAVVGIPDDEWGERVAAYIVLRLPTSATAESLREWGKERLAPYKVPRVFHVVDELPRNEMGKVVKPTLRQAAESLTWLNR
jgi:malonyl-CoA/methylmalonyl-CoA synthetase